MLKKEQCQDSLARCGLVSFFVRHLKSIVAQRVSDQASFALNSLSTFSIFHSQCFPPLTISIVSLEGALFFSPAAKDKRGFSSLELQTHPDNLDSLIVFLPFLVLWFISFTCQQVLMHVSGGVGWVVRGVSHRDQGANHPHPSSPLSMLYNTGYNSQLQKTVASV